MEKINKGSIVKFKKEFQDEGDDEIVFVALEDEDGDRVLVMAMLGKMLNPTHVMRTEWLESVEHLR